LNVQRLVVEDDVTSSVDGGLILVDEPARTSGDGDVGVEGTRVVGIEA